jgi:hypothetical protein
MPVRALRGRGMPRVDDDMAGAGRSARVQVLHGRRHRVGRVRADQQDGPRPGQISERERQAAVEAQRAVHGRRRRRHAEPSIVVDRCRAQRDANELAQRVRLLVGKPSAAERADAVPAVPALAVPDRRNDPVERLAPRRFAQGAGAVARVLADQRPEQAVRVVEQLRRGPALGAQAAAVHIEVGRLELDRRRDRPQRDPALQRAVGAVCLRDRHVPTMTGERFPRAPPRLRRRMELPTTVDRSL